MKKIEQTYFFSLVLLMALYMFVDLLHEHPDIQDSHFHHENFSSSVQPLRWFSRGPLAKFVLDIVIWIRCLSKHFKFMQKIVLTYFFQILKIICYESRFFIFWLQLHIFPLKIISISIF